MRRISIDTLGLMSPKGDATFEAAKRKRTWYNSRPRLLATCLLFVGFWIWLNVRSGQVPIPEDSFEYLKDESLRDILNTTLGVGHFDTMDFDTSRAIYAVAPGIFCPQLRAFQQRIVLTDSSSRRFSYSTFPSAPIVAMPCHSRQQYRTSSLNL